MIRSHKTVIFWGAGATASLGFPTTPSQADFLRRLAATGNGKGPLLQDRVRCALQNIAVEPWVSALEDLLTILGDDEKPEEFRIGTFTPAQMEAMRRSWRRGADDGDLRDRIANLRTLYDWPALKATIDICPRVVNKQPFQLFDLFNILDMHAQNGHGFPMKTGQLLVPQRVPGARNALKMLVQTMFYIHWHEKSRTNPDLNHHYGFAVALARRMQRQGLSLARSETKFYTPEFYMGDVSFVCLNWDPVGLWCQFVANRDLNHSPSVPHVDGPACKLKIFHDLGHFVAGPKVKKDPANRAAPYHPMNETVARRLNDPEHSASDRIRITKFLFPHGCLWWRECPNCGKLSSYMGDEWKRNSPTLLPPPPLRAFVPGKVRFRPVTDKEEEAWERGMVDSRECIHCNALTEMHHTPLQMQSNFKRSPPPFMDEIQRDMRVVYNNADHVVFMGYSLPPDDVDFRAFFSAHRRRYPDKPNDSVKCSVVERGGDRRWLGPSEWPGKLGTMKKGEAPRTTLEAARDLFGEKNVRFYGGGIPQVWLDGGGNVTDSAVERLFTWSES